MDPHEFQSSQPAIARRHVSAEAGQCTPEAGRYACEDCWTATVAALITLQEGQRIPLCHTCGHVTTYQKIED